MPARAYAFGEMKLSKPQARIIEFRSPSQLEQYNKFRTLGTGFWMFRRP
jgi:hypothetical protein